MYKKHNIIGHVTHHGPRAWPLQNTYILESKKIFDLQEKGQIMSQTFIFRTVDERW